MNEDKWLQIKVIYCQSKWVVHRSWPSVVGRFSIFCCCCCFCFSFVARFREISQFTSETSHTECSDCRQRKLCSCIAYRFQPVAFVLHLFCGWYFSNIFCLAQATRYIPFCAHHNNKQTKHTHKHTNSTNNCTDYSGFIFHTNAIKITFIQTMCPKALFRIISGVANNGIPFLSVA